MEEFESQQQACYANLANACFQILPEHWTMLELIVERTKEGMAHSITGSDEDNELVMPNDSVFEASYAIEELFSKHSKKWDSLTFKLQWNEEKENWNYQADYTYPITEMI